jgi:hypothetical protein
MQETIPFGNNGCARYAYCGTNQYPKEHRLVTFVRVKDGFVDRINALRNILVSYPNVFVGYRKPALQWLFWSVGTSVSPFPVKERKFVGEK